MKNKIILLIIILNMAFISVSLAKELELDEQQNIQAFFPTATSVSLKINVDPLLTHLGNVVVIADLDSSGIDQLFKVNRQASIAVLGGEPSTIVLRDDGKDGDDVAGDQRFSFLAFIDLEALENKSLSQVKLIGKSIPVYNEAELINDRVFDDAFNFSIFKQGKEVIYTSSPLTLHNDLFSDSDKIRVTDPATAFERRVLMITDPLVVNDPTRTYEGCFNQGNPDGVWTFKHLMTAMANESETGISPSDFVEQWLNQWLVEHNNTLTNYDTIIEKLIMKRIIVAWLEASGGNELDLDIAPFRLLAINPRIDLRHPLTGSTFLDSGEARFIFGLAMSDEIFDSGSFNAIARKVSLSGPHEVGYCRLFPMSVIVEYGIQKTSCDDVKQWALDWISLNEYTLGSETYNAALQNLTEQFTESNIDLNKPNYSALNQIRTNENALSGARWRQREFNIIGNFSNHGFLNFVTTKETPRNNLKNTITFDDFILQTPVTGVLPPVPLLFDDKYFLGANSKFLSNLTDSTWLTVGIDLSNPDNVTRRHRRALNTCDGCHAAETGTVFHHVHSQSTPGSPAQLSGFLTGIDVVDPEPSINIVRHFDDLERRTLDILTVANMSCLSTGRKNSKSQLSIDDLLRINTSRVH